MPPKQPPRGAARVQRADAGQSYEMEPGIRLFGSGGKIARSLAKYQGQGRSAAVDIEGPSGAPKAVSQVARPRPGKIEVPHNAPALPESSVGPGHAIQQALALEHVSPTPQKSSEPHGPATHEVARFESSPEDRKSYGSFLHSNRPQSPHNDREALGVGSPRQLSPRPIAPSSLALSPASAPGHKLWLQSQKASAPPKIAFGRAVYSSGVDRDQISAMSTVSVASMSEESVPARKFRPLQRSQSAGALSSRGMGSSPPKSYAWRKFLDQSYKDNFLAGSPRSQHSPRSQIAESPVTGKSHNTGGTLAHTGHSDVVPLYFDRGRGVPDCPGVAQSSALLGASANVETPELPYSGKAFTEMSQRMNEGLDAKRCMTRPPESRSPRSPPDRLNPSEKSVAGVTSKMFPVNRIERCCLSVVEATSNLGERSASFSSTCASKKQFQNALNESPGVKAGIDHDRKGEEGEEDFHKAVHGRQMRLGRQLSEPPRCREKMKKYERRHLHHKDYTKDESVGAIVPCVSPETVRASEKHECLPWDRRAPGEFKSGTSEFTYKLRLRAETSGNPVFRVEHLDRSLNEGGRDSSPSRRLSPSRRNNPAMGEPGELESARAGRSGSSSRHDINPPAGMTTTDLGKTSTMSQTNQMEKPAPRGKINDHLESPLMTSILKNSVAKDADRIRAFRETYDRPFAELCSAFASIRESHNKDAHRIRNEVCMNSSHNVASLLHHSPERQSPERQSPRSQSCGANVRTARSHPKDSPAAPMQSPGRLSPSRSPFNSLQMEQALRWIC